MSNWPVGVGLASDGTPQTCQDHITWTSVIPWYTRDGVTKDTLQTGALQRVMLLKQTNSPQLRLLACANTRAKSQQASHAPTNHPPPDVGRILAVLATPGVALPVFSDKTSVAIEGIKHKHARDT